MNAFVLPFAAIDLTIGEDMTRETATTNCSRDANLDEIEKALNEKIERMEREAADMALESEYGQASRIASEASGVSKAWFIVKRIIERQHSNQHEAG